MTDFEAVFIVSGLAFLFLSFLGAGSTRVRITAFLVGILLMIVGIAVHTNWIPQPSPKPSVGNETPAPKISNSPSPNPANAMP